MALHGFSCLAAFGALARRTTRPMTLGLAAGAALALAFALPPSAWAADAAAELDLTPPRFEPPAASDAAAPAASPASPRFPAAPAASDFNAASARTAGFERTASRAAADGKTSLGLKPAALSGALTFEAARALYHQRADLLQADEAEVARAQHAAEAAKSLSGPRVEATVMQVEGRKEINLNADVPLGSLGAAIGGILGGAAGGGLPAGLSIPSSMNVGLHENLDIGGPRAMITAIWPLYTGGAISAQQAALGYKVGEAAAARDLRREAKDAELALQYWGVQLARSIEDLRRRMLADEEEEVRRAKAFESRGVISKLERMAVEVSRDGAKRALAAARADARTAETALMNALREKTLPALDTPLFVLSGDLGGLAAWQDAARRRSPLLAQAEALQSQAGEGVKAAKSAWQPQLFAFGMRNLIQHYLTIPEPDWIAGIGVKFTLWSNTDRAQSVAAAESLAHKAGAAKAEAENALRTAVETAWIRAGEARSEHALCASTVALARESLRLREASFAQGLSTAADVSNARSQLAAAEVAKRAAAYKFVAAWAMLHAAAGAMPEFVASLSREDLVPER